MNFLTLKRIQLLKAKGGTLRFFNGADWYIADEDGIVHYFNTVLNTTELKSPEWSKWYCDKYGARDDFQECIQSWIDASIENLENLRSEDVRR
jgi:hypothetical protein